MAGNRQFLIEIIDKQPHTTSILSELADKVHGLKFSKIGFQPIIIQ